MITIKRINPGSAAKVGAIVALLTSAILNLIIFGLQALFIGALTNVIVVDNLSGTSNFQASGGDVFAAVSLVTLCLFYGISLILAAIFGGIGGLVLAIAYNITANWVGGLEMELDDNPAKAKRRVLQDDIYE